jgi:hypothetical protein
MSTAENGSKEYHQGVMGSFSAFCSGFNSIQQLHFQPTPYFAVCIAFLFKPLFIP